MDEFDICIAGAGVIGLAICHQLSTHPRFAGRSILLLDQESAFGQHTSSRNSEVIHAGIYYQSNSLKAKLCVEGNKLLYAYCTAHQIPHKKIQKLIVAQQADGDGLSTLLEKAEANGVFDLQCIDRHQLRTLEPQIKGEAALLSPSTGIIDSHSYMQSLLHSAQANGAEFYPRTRIEKLEALQSGFKVHTLIEEKNNLQHYQFFCRQFINSAGLYAQDLAKNIEGLDCRHIPALHLCKGDYFAYKGRNPFSHLIYPMPEENETGLGVHATLDMGSQLRFGPDAEFIEEIDYDIDQSKAGVFAESIRSYFPAIRAEDLSASYSGIRPKISAPGEAAADFNIQSGKQHGIDGLVQLFGMESPALTSSLAIANHVISELQDME